MNYWPRWINAIRKRTASLSLAQMGAYDRLLDHYYAEEAPLPGSLEECCRIAGAINKAEADAVRYVLSKFFTQTPDGFTNERADEEIQLALPKIEAAKVNGKKGGRPRSSISEEYMPIAGCLYAIRIDGNRVKVGISSNFKSRLHQHRHKLGSGIKVLHRVDVSHMGDAEWELLSAYDSIRTGEILPIKVDGDAGLIATMNGIASRFPMESGSHTQSHSKSHTQSEPTSKAPHPQITEELSIESSLPTTIGVDRSSDAPVKAEVVGVEDPLPDRDALVAQTLRLCKAAGMAPTMMSGSHPGLIAALTAGVSPEEIAAHVPIALQDATSNPWGYAISAARNTHDRRSGPGVGLPLRQAFPTQLAPENGPARRPGEADWAWRKRLRDRQALGLDQPNPITVIDGAPHVIPAILGR